MWTVSQRRALIALTALAAAGLAVLRWAHPAFIGLDPAVSGARSAELALLDPNTASAAELATLPGLGRAKAAALVAFREEFAKTHGNVPAFRRPEDLKRVKGIGQATAEKLAQYLQFHP